jgi:putative membrane protein
MRRKLYTIRLTAIWFVLVWSWAALQPTDRFMWFLENILTVLFVCVFIFLHRFYHFSSVSYVTIALFLTLHTVGAHYSYRTPIDPWLSQWFTLDRAYYDRVVHFCFGLLLVVPVKDFLAQIITRINRWLLYAFAIMAVFAAGAFYELIEMWVALIVAPDQGAAFIGIQGDEWDTQHDMELALYGSILAMGCYAGLKGWRDRLRK